MYFPVPLHTGEHFPASNVHCEVVHTHPWPWIFVFPWRSKWVTGHWTPQPSSSIIKWILVLADLNSIKSSCSFLTDLPLRLSSHPEALWSLHSEPNWLSKWKGASCPLHSCFHESQSSQRTPKGQRVGGILNAVTGASWVTYFLIWQISPPATHRLRGWTVWRGHEHERGLLMSVSLGRSHTGRK